MMESEIRNIKFGSPDWEITNDNSMFEKQDAVTSKVGS